MSEMAKAARAAMKKKAQSMIASDANQKVDSSTWTPSEPLETTAKTGMRPISRRAFKKGGKVEGDCVPVRADRKPRKAGGNAMPPVDRYINRDEKKANEFREGVKHVGNMKKGGRAGKDEGGTISKAIKRIRDWATDVPEEYGQKPNTTPTPPPVNTTPSVSEEDRAKMDALVKKNTNDNAIKSGDKMKSGGKAKKAYGSASKGIQKIMEADQEQLTEAPSRMQFEPTTSRLSNATGLKKGGTAKKHDDEKMDKALIKKMVKPESRKGKKDGGMVAGGRTAHARGGKAGKTNVNIIISPGQPNQPADMMPSPGGMPPKPPGGMPVAVPPPNPAAGAPPPSIMPVPMPMPMPMPQQLAGGPPPMGRKSGGRAFSSYKDMKAGAGSGKGRLQKIDKYGLTGPEKVR